MIAVPGNECLLGLRGKVSNESDKALKAGMQAAYMNATMLAADQFSPKAILDVLEAQTTLHNVPIGKETIPMNFNLVEKIVEVVFTNFPKPIDETTGYHFETCYKVASESLRMIDGARSYLLPEEKQFENVMILTNAYFKFQTGKAEVDALKVDDTIDASLVSKHLDKVNNFRRLLSRLIDVVPVDECKLLNDHADVKKEINHAIELGKGESIDIAVGPKQFCLSYSLHDCAHALSCFSHDIGCAHDALGQTMATDDLHTLS